jgi:hypothetical protein
MPFLEKVYTRDIIAQETRKWISITFVMKTVKNINLLEIKSLKEEIH